MQGLSIALLAVLCNVSAQVLMKLASQSGLQLRALNGNFPWHLLTSIALYGLSFFLTLQVLAKNDLNIVSPAMAGMIFVGVAFGSYFFLHEPMNGQKIIGMLVIFVGIFILLQSST